MTILQRLAFVLVLLAAAAAARADVRDAKIIANTSVGVSSLTQEELRGILLITRTSLADGVHLEPVLLKSGPVHERLIRGVTGKTASGLDSYYRSLVFTGKGVMPRRFATESEVVAYVRATRGAIGYVSPGTAADGVKVLDVK